MRALILEGTKTQLSTSRPEPRPARGEAVIRPRLVGVSRTDLELSRGLLDFRGVLGHEFVGEVEAVEGGDPSGLVGRRVVGAIAIFCGQCAMCQAGLRQHCRERTLLGIDGRDGCFADRFALPAANLVPVPASVDDDHAVFAEPLASALEAVRQLTIEGKPYITVLGDGALGLLMVQVMARLNASVRLVGRSPDRLAICEKWGIKHRAVDDIGRRADQDIVVDCTGSSEGLETALELVRPRGTVVLKSLHARGESGRPDLTQVVLKEVTLLGSHRGPVGEAVTMLERREVDVVSLISRRMKLDDGPAILAAAAQPDVIKVLVTV